MSLTSMVQQARSILSFGITVVLVGCGSSSSTSQDSNSTAQDEGIVVQLGVDQVVSVGRVVMLEAGTSGSIDSSELQFEWGLASKPLDSSAVLSSNSSTASFTTDSAGSYVVSVTVEAQNGAIDVDTMLVSTESTGLVSVSNSIGDTALTSCGYQAGSAEVVSYQVGTPSPAVTSQTPLKALGIPDYSLEGVDTGENRGFVTLGCGGQLILRWPNGMVDGTGADLAVFEIGEMVESTNIEISSDCLVWEPLTTLTGGLGLVDISGLSNPDVTYHCIRLTDLQSSCDGNYPGADIDAVLTLNCP